MSCLLRCRVRCDVFTGVWPADLEDSVGGGSSSRVDIDVNSAKEEGSALNSFRAALYSGDQRAREAAAIQCQAEWDAIPMFPDPIGYLEAQVLTLRDKKEVLQQDEHHPERLISMLTPEEVRIYKVAQQRCFDQGDLKAVVALTRQLLAEAWGRVECVGKDVHEKFQRLIEVSANVQPDIGSDIGWDSIADRVDVGPDVNLYPVYLASVVLTGSKQAGQVVKEDIRLRTDCIPITMWKLRLRDLLMAIRPYEHFAYKFKAERDGDGHRVFREASGCLNFHKNAI